MILLCLNLCFCCSLFAVCFSDTYTTHRCRYAHALLQSLTPPLTTPTSQLNKELDDLAPLVDEQWRRVVVFILLRLTLAPCVESIILLDRVLFLIEQGGGMHGCMCI